MEAASIYTKPQKILLCDYLKAFERVNDISHTPYVPIPTSNYARRKKLQIIHRAIGTLPQPMLIPSPFPQVYSHCPPWSPIHQYSKQLQIERIFNHQKTGCAQCPHNFLTTNISQKQQQRHPQPLPPRNCPWYNQPDMVSFHERPTRATKLISFLHTE